MLTGVGAWDKAMSRGEDLCDPLEMEVGTGEAITGGQLQSWE